MQHCTMIGKNLNFKQFVQPAAIDSEMGCKLENLKDSEKFWEITGITQKIVIILKKQK